MRERVRMWERERERERERINFVDILGGVESLWKNK